ncbi:MAG TPA: hypothetical protein VJL89_03245 [Thermodesulfovibrionia bacterium]|nr:hypothetical protein [Thermodesulfovibrionia bacterium]
MVLVAFFIINKGIDIMKWPEIRSKYPDKFILVGDIIEEKISERKYRILEGKVLKVSDNPKEIMEDYEYFNRKGMNVLYALPNTPQEFIVENVLFLGILK